MRPFDWTPEYLHVLTWADGVSVTGRGRGLRLVMAGVLIGAVAALASTRVLAHLLYRVSPADPGTLAAIVLLVLGIAFAAAWVPARRATRIAPTDALRAG